MLATVFDLLRDWLRNEAARDRKLRREQESELQRRAHDRAEQKEKADKQDEVLETLLELGLISEEIRRAFVALQNDIDDAIRGLQILSEKAALEQAAALGALEEVRRNAIMLADGRRVYFAADGRTLFDESGAEISDAKSIEEARLIHQKRPGAPNHEAYVRAFAAHEETSARAEELAIALDRLDDLKTRLRSGRASQQEVEAARSELAQILETLPESARADYERLRDGRSRDASPPYRDAPKTYDASLDFAKASQPLPDVKPKDAPGALPAYKAAPEF